MNAGPGILIAGVAMLVALAGCGGGKVESGPYQALGEVAAKATSDLLGGKGKVVLLLSDADAHADTALGQAVKAFGETLKKESGAQVGAMEKLPISSRPAISGVEPLPAELFLELVAKHVEADALVSFVGVPRLTADQIGQLPQPQPKIVSAVTFNTPSKAMFARGVVQLAIVAQAAGDVPAGKPATTLEWFAANYRLITPESMAAAP